MESYKELNRALTLQNQELRQQVALYEKELILLNRRQMTERQLKQSLHQNYVNFVNEVSKLCTKAMCEFHQLFQDTVDANANMSRVAVERRTEENVSPRSKKSVQKTFKPVVDNAAHDKENIPALNSDGDGLQVSYVQTRRRRKPDRSNNPLETIPLTYVVPPNTSSTEVVENTEQSTDADGTLSSNDQAASVDRDLHTIYEGSSRELSQSILSTRNEKLRLCSQSSITIDSSRESATLLPEASQTNEQNVRSVPIIEINCTSVENQASENSSKVNRSEQTVLNEDTIFNNFRTMKVVSSTPYKAPMPNQIKKCFVKVKKLKDMEILVKQGDILNSDLGVSKEQQNKLVDTIIKKRSRQPSRPAYSRHGLSSQIQSESTNAPQDSNYSTESISRNLTRPKRHAAPVNLREPDIHSKLRRNN